MEDKTKKKLIKVVGITAVTAVIGVATYYGYKVAVQKGFNEGLVKGAAIGRDAVVNILRIGDPDSGLISSLRNIGIKVSKM